MYPKRTTCRFIIFLIRVGKILGSLSNDDDDDAEDDA